MKVYPVPLWERVARMSEARCEPVEGSVSADKDLSHQPSVLLISRPPSASLVAPRTAEDGFAVATRGKSAGERVARYTSPGDGAGIAEATER
jgi:hypothetical protein